MIGGKENKTRKGGQEEERRTKKKIGRGVKKRGKWGKRTTRERRVNDLKEIEGKEKEEWMIQTVWCKCSNWRKKHF